MPLLVNISSVAAMSCLPAMNVILNSNLIYKLEKISHENELDFVWLGGYFTKDSKEATNILSLNLSSCGPFI